METPRMTQAERHQIACRIADAVVDRLGPKATGYDWIDLYRWAKELLFDGELWEVYLETIRNETPRMQRYHMVMVQE